jgi:tetratricopeptide (TPR) repeat protein
MYTTPHSKIYFLQTRTARILVLALLVCGGVATALVMDLIFEKIGVMMAAMAGFYLLFVPLTSLILKLTPETTARLYGLLGYYLLFIVLDRITRPINSNTWYFIGFGVLNAVLQFGRIIMRTEKQAAKELNTRVAFIRGANAYKSDDFTFAIAEFTQSIAFGNRSRSVYYFRGICYGMIDQYPEALSDFRDVMAIDPAFEDVYFWRGLTYYSIDPNHEQASADFERVVAKCTDEELKDHARHHLQTIQRAAAAPADAL